VLSAGAVLSYITQNVNIFSNVSAPYIIYHTQQTDTMWHHHTQHAELTSWYSFAVPLPWSNENMATSLI